MIDDIFNADKIRVYNEDYGSSAGSILSKEYSIIRINSSSTLSDISPLYRKWLILDRWDYNNITEYMQKKIEPSAYICDSDKWDIFLPLGKFLKVFIPPHTEKVEFIDGNNRILYTENFTHVENEEKIYDNTYLHYCMLRYEKKNELVDTDKTFEDILHKQDNQAHDWDIILDQADISIHSQMIGKEYYTELYEKTADGNSSDVINGNILTNTYNLYYLGERVPMKKDMFHNIPEWEQSEDN